MLVQRREAAMHSLLDGLGSWRGRFGQLGLHLRREEPQPLRDVARGGRGSHRALEQSVLSHALAAIVLTKRVQLRHLSTRVRSPLSPGYGSVCKTAEQAAHRLFHQPYELLSETSVRAAVSERLLRRERQHLMHNS